MKKVILVETNKLIDLHASTHAILVSYIGSTLGWIGAKDKFTLNGKMSFWFTQDGASLSSIYDIHLKGYSHS